MFQNTASSPNINIKYNDDITLVNYSTNGNPLYLSFVSATYHTCNSEESYSEFSS